MKYYIILITLFANCIVAQNRVTSHVEIVDLPRSFVKEVDGQNYLVNLSNDNIVRVNKINENGNLTLMNTFQNYDLGSNTKINLFKSKIITFGNFGIGYQDFLTDERGGVTIASGDLVTGQELIHANQNSMIVKGKLTNDAAFFYFEFNKNFESLPSSLEAISVGEKHVFTQKKDGSTNREYYIYNPNSERTEILIDATNQFHGVHFTKDKAWYLENENYVMYIDLKTYKRTDLNIQSKYDKPYKNIITKNDEILIYQGTKDSAYYETYSLTTKAKIKDFKHKVNGNISPNYMEWKGDYLFFKTDRGSVGSLNTKTGTLHEFPSTINYKFQEWPLIDDRYLLVRDVSSLRVDDLHTGMSFSTSWPSTLVASHPSIIKVGSDYMASIMTNNSNQFSKVYQFNLDQKSIVPTTKFDSITIGLVASSTLRKHSQDVTLLANDIYDIKDGRATQINQNKLMENYDKVFHSSCDGKIHYASIQEDSIHFYTYLDHKETEETTIAKPAVDIQLFNLTSSYLYTFDKTGKFFRTDKKTKQSTRLTGVENSRILYYNACYADNFFLTKDYNVIKLGDDGSQAIEASAQSNYLQQFNGNLYLTADEDIYIWTEDGFKTMDDKLTSPRFVSIPNSDLLLVTSTYDRKWSVVENDNITYTLDDATKFAALTPINIGTDFGLFQNNLNENFILDYRQKIFIPLSQNDILSSSRLLAVYKMSSDTLALVSSGDLLATYKLTNYFKNSTKINETQIPEIINTLKLTINETYGLMTTDKNHYYIDEKGQVVLLSTLGIPDQTNTPVINDEYIYFFASDQVWGRQLYSLKKEDVSSVESENANDQITTIKLYPNPTTNTLSFVGIENYLNTPYQITDILGQKIKSGWLSDRHIDISEFEAGMYFLSIEAFNTNRIVTQSFIKF